MSADAIRRMSEQLATDPSSLVFLPLGEMLLQRGELVNALRVARRGAARHPERADARDLIARIALAYGDEAGAEEAWREALGIAPDFSAAHRGLGFLCFRQERWEDAEEHLAFARAATPGDPAVESAWTVLQAAWVEAVSAPDPGPPPLPPVQTAATVFDRALEGTSQVALLLDADGLLVAGSYVTADGEDLGALIGGQLSGVSDEAARAMRHFGLGAWTRILLETEAATVMMAPSGEGITLVAAPRDVPLGYVRRTLDHSAAAATAWLTEGR